MGNSLTSVTDVDLIPSHWPGFCHWNQIEEINVGDDSMNRPGGSGSSVDCMYDNDTYPATRLFQYGDCSTTFDGDVSSAAVRRMSSDVDGILYNNTTTLDEDVTRAAGMRISSGVDAVLCNTDDAALMMASELRSGAKEADVHHRSERYQDLGFTPECEVLAEGGPNLFDLMDTCPKHPGHHQFIPVDELKPSHLPQQYQTDEWMSTIRHLCDRTVRVLISYTSLERPDTYPDTDIPYPYWNLKGLHVQRCGTGILTFPKGDMDVEGKPCPCPVCVETGNHVMGYTEIFVTTATHVLCDDAEALSSIFECFYDSENREGVMCVYGIKIEEKYDRLDKYTTDRCTVLCVTHEVELRRKLQGMKQKFQLTDMSAAPSGFVISHPHGCSKRVTVGNILQYLVPHDDNINGSKLYRFGTDAKCRIFPDPNNHVSNLESNQNNMVVTKPPFPFCLSKMVPGDEYPLPRDIQIALPENPAYFIQRRSQNGPWTTFLPGTRFYLPNGRCVILPSNIEIYWGKNHLKEHWLRYMTYDIPTCPGSSGAPVFNHDPVMHTTPWILHTGALDRRTNRSIVAKGFDTSAFQCHENDF